MTDVVSDREERLRALLAARQATAAARVPQQRDPAAPVRLSAAQHAMWLLWQLDPDSPAYHVPVPLRLSGPLDEPALRAAITDVVARHDVLRTVIGADGAVTLRPAEAVPLRGATVPESDLDRLAAEGDWAPFALDTAPPMRVALWSADDGDEHLLLFTFHHIAMDAWSIRLFLDELAAAYTARMHGGPTPTDPAPQYADLPPPPTDRVAAAVAWWRDRLTGLPPALDLPTDTARDARVRHDACHVPVHVPAELADRMRAYAREHGCTPFMLLLASLQVLLARLSGSTDIAIGVPEAGRHHADSERVLGSFINTLVVRGDVTPDRTGRRLVAAARDAALAAYAHAEAPFAQVVDAVGAPRTPGLTPLFQVLLNVYDAVPAPQGFPDLRVRVTEPLPPTAKFDLSWNIEDHGPDGMHGLLVTRRDLIGGDTAARLVAWHLALLDGILSDPDTPVQALPLAPVTAPLLAGPDPAADPRPMHALFEQAADRDPDAVAVVGPDGARTYAELDRSANRLAHRLLAAGVGPGDTVGVLCERGTGLAAALLGVLKAGAAYVPLDPAYPTDRITAMLAAAGARVVLTDADLAGRVTGDVATVVVDAPADAPDHRPGVTVGAGDLVYVIFTSGSTGQPKGVAVEHGQLVRYLAGALGRMGPDLGSYALVSTIAADLGLTNVFGALATGATLHLVDREVATDPVALAAYLAEHPVDVLKCVPSHLEMLAAHGDLAALLPRRLLLVAGEPCPWTLVHRIRALRPDLAVQNSYGPTETTVAVFMCDVDEVPEPRRHGVVPLGRPLPGVRCHVTGPDGRPVPVGMPGELWIGGPSVARGYAGRDDLTAERFVPDPLDAAGRCYRTGDRVQLMPDGEVRFLGRLDDQVKVRGFRIELGEVAAALRDAPGVAEAAVLPVGEAHQRRLVAWIAPQTADPAAVRAALRARLPEYMLPSALVTLPALPLTPNGKVDRAALPVPDSRGGAGDGGPPQTAYEQRVAQVWQAILGVDTVGRDDDFFALGGDSFQAVRAVRDIDPGLRVIDLFTASTVRDLGALLQSRAEGGDTAAGLLHRLGGPPAGTAADLTVVCVPYGGGSAAAYRPLAEALGPKVATLAAELPGHDPARPDEPLLALDELVDRLADEVIATVSGPLLVYGHCVGTAVATALARRLEARGITLVGLVVGGAFPAARLPGRLSALVNRILPTDRMVSDRSYRDWLRLIGGMEDLDEAETDRMMLSLRHDARQSEDWFTAELTRPQPQPLTAPVLCVVGERDRSTELYQERHLEWAAFAPRVELATIPRAGHYFVKHQAGQLAAIIGERVAAWRAGRLPSPRTADGAVHGSRMRHDLRAFYTVAFGQTVSLVGSAIGSFALGVWAYQRSGRTFDYALVTMLAMLPTIAFLPVGGALADRLDRRRIMFVCDGLSALVMLVLALLLWRDQLSLAVVALAAGLGSTITAFHRPAWLAAVAQLVPKPYLTQANALAQLGTGIGMLLAPLAGGALIVAVGLPWVVALDVASFMIGLLTLLAVRFPDRLFRRRDETLQQALLGGWRYLTRRRPLMVMIVYFMLVNYLFTVALVASTPMVLAFGDAGDLGLVTAASGAGAALGSLVMLVWGGTRRRATGMVGFVIGVGLGVALMGLRPSVVLICAGALLWWASLSILNAHWMAMIQLKVGLELQGRVLATNQMLAVAMTPLAFVTAPLVADHVFTPLLDTGGALAGSLGPVLGVGPGRGMGLLLLVAGVALVLLGIAGLRYRPLARMEDALPNATTGAEIPDDLDGVQAEADRALAVQAGAAAGRP
ncbi:non-ribosomal peptide synthetase/MFS transporter [Catellatospora tritici]|uniref:non-ribosomal peptide synthetase/MFS transporter n=1 Tax=Catellatospora tritici TaxID=2851566 RepID=UPI001C2D33A7|nr:non-ribosomal peptide synthetase/MFS transporter [Catellatospora tritici]MBV1850666.1 amino acid adenylation domain-containing protein [Catellatospora tritici]